MKIFLTFLMIQTLLITALFGQNQHTIKVYFKYGSKPARHFKKTEEKYFGGIHGGHVSIGVDTAVIGFSFYYGYHIFPNNKKLNGVYNFEGIHKFRKDTVGFKYTTFQISLTDTQYYKLNTIFNNYLFLRTPYDYALFGMRCAAAAYDVLSQIGIFKVRSRCCNIISNFYPKLLRKKMFKLAKKNNYTILKHAGRTSRKWERD